MRRVMITVNLEFHVTVHIHEEETFILLNPYIKRTVLFPYTSASLVFLKKKEACVFHGIKMTALSQLASDSNLRWV